MDVQLIGKLGDDLTVVNAARVSFDKQSTWDTVLDYEFHGEDDYVEREYKDQLKPGDQKLINYLARHGHWTPFAHVQITMRETVPIFVARQRFKHTVGFVYNEISRRYVDSPPEFYYPDEWRLRADDKKQGSSEEVLQGLDFDAIDYGYHKLMDECEAWYNNALEHGVAPEQARMALPQSMYTSYYCTGSLSAWARAYKLRSEETAQKEIQFLAQRWDEIIGGMPELKDSWKALTNEQQTIST